jgi:hypothetical protein
VNGKNNKIYVTEPGGKVDIYTLITQYTLSVSEKGSGAVKCGGLACKPSYKNIEPVRLEAEPGEGYVFVGWTIDGAEACVGSSVCEITLNKSTTVVADFALEEHELTVTTSGSGEVQSVPAGIEKCGATCKAKFVAGELISLTATAAAHNHFVGWKVTGEPLACTGTGPCQIVLGKDTSVEALFAADPVPVEKPVEKPAEKPVEKPVETPVEKPVVKKHLTRGQLLAAAIRKCKKLPRHKQAACIKRAKKKYAPPRHKRKKRK